MLRVLLTGCAGDIGRSISRILKENGSYIVGIDINKNYPYHLYVDEFLLAPSATSHAYIPFLEKTVENKSVDLVIPTTEIELLVFLNAKKRDIGRKPIVMANEDLLKVGLDKKKTFKMLERCGISIPKTYYSNEELSVKQLPVIYKERCSSGSKGVEVIWDGKDIQPLNHDKIAQELLQPADQEYTCAIYVGRNRMFRCLVIRRELQAGRTIYGEVVNNPKINAYLHKVCRDLNVYGSINIQLILTKEGPKLFEINPRFSSTVYFRHLLGFKDVEWFIKDTLSIPYDVDFDIDKVKGKKIFLAEREIVY